MVRAQIKDVYCSRFWDKICCKRFWISQFTWHFEHFLWVLGELFWKRLTKAKFPGHFKLFSWISRELFWKTLMMAIFLTGTFSAKCEEYYSPAGRTNNCYNIQLFTTIFTTKKTLFSRLRTYTVKQR